MTYQYPTLQASFRFRRLTRRAWAVFASMGREVTIGTLRVAVSEPSLAKTQADVNYSEVVRCEQLEEEDELEEVLLPALEWMTVVAVAPVAAEKEIKCLRIFSAVGMVLHLSAAFCFI